MILSSCQKPEKQKLSSQLTNKKHDATPTLIPMGDWCGSVKDRHHHQLKNRVQKREKLSHGASEVTLQENHLFCDGEVFST